MWDWRDGPAGKSSGCSSRGPDFDSQHLQSGSQLSVTPVPEDPRASLASMGIRHASDV